MKNCLYIAPYRQSDGWGEASKCYLKALATCCNITAHPIYYVKNTETFSDPLISKYEENVFDHYDYLIQKCLPGDFFVNKLFKKNICLTELETSDWSKCYKSLENLNIADEVWVPSEICKKTLLKSGVITPIKVVSQPLDIESLQKQDAKPIIFPNILKNTFKFYFIGEYIERKNLTDLILAFNMAFSYDDNVSLIIKTNITGMSAQESKKLIEETIEKTKRKIGYKTKFKKELVITERLSYDNIISLHKFGDCFVMPSSGEAFCRPAIEALVLGKTPIVTKNTGMEDFINNDNGFLVNSNKTMVCLEHKSVDSRTYDFYGTHQHWYSVNIYDLIEKMKQAYLDRNSEEMQKKREEGKKLINNFSYESIGKKICL